MVVVPHDDVRVQSPTMFNASLAQCVFECFGGTGSREDVLPVVSTINDVVNRPFDWIRNRRAISPSRTNMSGDARRHHPAIYQICSMRWILSLTCNGLTRLDRLAWIIEDVANANGS
jgi:hypothetical protein